MESEASAEEAPKSGAMADLRYSLHLMSRNKLVLAGSVLAAGTILVALLAHVIVPASAKVPLKVTGNTGRLALRQPKSKIAAALLEALGQPLIATSANISGQPTCRSGIEAFGMMDGRVDLVLDGGLCTGAGSTTVDVTEPYWRIIREGSIPEKDIAACLKPA